MSTNSQTTRSNPKAQSPFGLTNHGGIAADLAAAKAEIERLQAEIADLRSRVIAFGGPWSALLGMVSRHDG
jgi:hypothetical protein